MNTPFLNVLLTFELDKSIKYLRLGLGEIQKITAENDFYEPVFLFLSGGLERLFKVVLCLNSLEKNNKLPRNGVIWNNQNGHDIIFLKKEIEKTCISINRHFEEEDFDIIQDDDFINEICAVFAQYAKRGRYFDMDAILGNIQEFEPKSEWEKIEKKLNLKHYGAEFYDLIKSPEMLESIISNSNQLILERLERFIRAVVRQLIYGKIYSNSGQFVFQVADFLNIADNQIGKTNYNDFAIYESVRR